MMDKRRQVEHYWLPLNLCWLVCFLILGLFQLDLGAARSDVAVPYSHPWTVWFVLIFLILSLKIRKFWYHLMVAILAFVVGLNTMV